MKPVQENLSLRRRDPISSYKCFEIIATPSPNAYGMSTKLNQATSLDSLVNSSEHESSSSEDRDDCISDEDSITEFETKTLTNSTEVSQWNKTNQRKSDLENLQNSDPQQEPVIKAYLEKSHLKCDYKNCSYKKFPESIERNTVRKEKESENNSDVEMQDKQIGTKIQNENADASDTISACATSAKNRRLSVASSGSVGRMETIVEEPNESKISVKEILARFETLSSLEIKSKTSTISSGARAAAHTLNVPIEHLEAKTQDNAANTALIPKPLYADNVHKRINSPNIQTEAFQYLENASKASSPSGDKGSLAVAYHDQDSEVYQHHNTKYEHMRDDVSNNAKLEHQHLQHMVENSIMNGTPVAKYSLLQFAIQHFRNDQAIDDYKKNERNDKQASRTSAISRPHTDLVKWQGTSIQAPLLRLPPELTVLALECFDCILRYCGDIPLSLEITEVKCVYTVLMHCHKHLALRDEVYCQLMKQTTTNRSQCSDSSQRAWRLLSVLAAYFGCSEALKPYLLEHLSSTASDRNRSSHGTAAVCLTNLRKTARCGGRKNVPSVEEVTAVSAGRSARRQIYRLPGGAERVVNTRCSTVVADVIAELCALLGIEFITEQQEFSLYCIVQGDAFTMPLAADEYILDVTTELLKSGQPFYLIFCRSVWHYQLRREPAPTPLYIEVLFNQVAPDYLEGLLLELPNGGAPEPDVVRDMARVAALLHRAADLNHVPAMKEIKFLLPKPALGIRELRPAQWVALVQSAWPSIAGLSPGQVKAQFLSLLATWTLFGSSFFAVKRVWAEDSTPPAVEEPASMWRDLILALNRRGVLFLDPNTHETLQHWPFMEVISTRKVRSEDGALYLDMKVGNLMQQRVIRVQTEQAHEISRLVRQYITMAQVGHQQNRRE